MSGRSLGGFVALFATLFCVACASSGGGQLVPVNAPLLSNIVVGPVLPDIKSPKTVIALNQADAALREGKHRQALGHLEAALAALPKEGGSPCGSRANLLYLRGTVAAYSHGDSAEAGWDKLRETCVDIQVEPADESARFFFATMADETEEDKSGDAEEGAGGAATVSAGFEAEASRLADAAKKIGGDRGKYFELMSRWNAINAEKSSNVCDDGFERRRRERLAAVYRSFQRMGRPDLDFSYWPTKLVDTEGNLDADAFTQFRAWAIAPENLWSRTSTLATALAQVWLAAEWPDPLITIPLCNMLHEDLAAALEVEGTEGFNGRNVSRLMSAFQVLGACLNHQSLVTMMDTALTASVKGENGQAGVLEVVLGISVDLVLAVVQGRTDLLGPVLTELLNGIQKVRAQLGETPEDRTLDAVLSMLTGVSTLLQGNLGYLLSTVEQSVEVFDKVAAGPIGPDSPDLVRLAPGLRTASLATLAVIYTLTENSAAANATLERLDKTVEADLSSLFTYLELPDHSGALVRLSRAVGPLVDALDEGGIPEVERAMAEFEVACKPDEGEEGWWVVGLDLIRAVGWDLLAMAAHEAKADTQFHAALNNAEVTLARSLNELCDITELPQVVRTLLALLPVAHRAIPDLVKGEQDDWEVAKSALRVLDQPVKDLLNQASEKLGKDAAATSVVANLVNDIFATAADVGLVAVVEDSEKSLARMADIVDEKLNRYPPDIRAFLGIGAAALRFVATPERAGEAFEAARRAAAEGLPELEYVPSLVEAALLFRDGKDRQGALKIVGDVLGYGDEALGCGKSHAVHSLLPFKMWALEREGQHAEAAEVYAQFTKLVEQGFSGDAPINCILRSQGEHVIFTADVGYTVAAFVLPGKQEGKFQIGLGAQSATIQQQGDQLTCQVSEIMGPRLDRVMEAHLAWAIYSLLRSDDKGAHRALRGAVAAGRKLVHGSAATLGRRGSAGIGQGREMLDLKLLVWASFAARLRGHSQSANLLDQLALGLLPYRDTSWDEVLEEAKELPALLREFSELEEAGELLGPWYNVANRETVDQVKKKLKKWAKGKQFVTKWGLLLAEDRMEELLHARAGKSERKENLKPPKRDKVGAAAIALRNLTAEADRTQALPNAEKFGNVAAALAAEEMYLEVAATATAIALASKQMGKPEIGLEVVRVAKEMVPAAVAPLLHSDLVGYENDFLSMKGDEDGVLIGLQEQLEVAAGYLPAETELSYRLFLFRLLGARNRGVELRRQVAALVPMIGRAYGTTHALFYTLLSVDLALKLESGDVRTEVLETLIAHAHMVQGSADTKEFFQMLLSANNRNQRSRLAEQYLAWLFMGGPKPVAPAAPPAEAGEAPGK